MRRNDGRVKGACVEMHEDYMYFNGPESRSDDIPTLTLLCPAVQDSKAESILGNRITKE